MKSLDVSQIRKLLSATESDPAIYMQILLALGTDLRRGDIEAIKVGDINFVSGCITTNSRKTRKTMASRPVPFHIMKELKFYVNSLPQEQELLFVGRSVILSVLFFCRFAFYSISAPSLNQGRAARKSAEEASVE